MKPMHLQTQPNSSTNYNFQKKNYSSQKNFQQQIRGSSSEEQFKKLKIRLSRNANNNSKINNNNNNINPAMTLQTQGREKSNERPQSFLQNIPTKSGMIRTESSEKTQSYNNYFHLKGQNQAARFPRKNQSTVMSSVQQFSTIQNFQNTGIMKSQEFSLNSAKGQNFMNSNNKINNNENGGMVQNDSNQKNDNQFFLSSLNSTSNVNQSQILKQSGTQRVLTENYDSNKQNINIQSQKQFQTQFMNMQQGGQSQQQFMKHQNQNDQQYQNNTIQYLSTQPNLSTNTNNNNNIHNNNQIKQSQSFVQQNHHFLNQSGAQRNNSQIQIQQQSRFSLPYVLPTPYKEPLQPNCTVYLIYKKQKLMIQFNVQDKTTDWVKQQLLLKCIQNEKEHNNPQGEQDLNKIVGFQSANKNISVSYYLTLPKKDIDIFKMATLSVEPILTEKYFPQQERINLQHFNLVKCIGLGGFSRVYLVQKKDTGIMYALKLIDKQFIIKNKKEVIVQNERNIMTLINHPYLLKLEYAFESKNYLGFAMEYCAGGELFFHLRRIKRMNEDQARFYFVEICLGIQYLHERSIIYRDIKPENILLDLDGHIRIGDFGLSKPDMDVNEFAYSFCGSPEYMAPEMLLKVGHTYTVDYYCLGALLYELVTGLPPYYSHNTDEIYESILSEELTFPNHVKLTNELRHLLNCLLIKHPMQRMGQQGGIKEILKHPWFKKINIKDVEDKKVPPPIKPDILSFNFDEEEFVKGEKEFKKKLVLCQMMQQEIGNSTQTNIFEEFYYDANVKKDKNYYTKSLMSQCFPFINNQMIQNQQQYINPQQTQFEVSQNYKFLTQGNMKKNPQPQHQQQHQQQPQQIISNIGSNENLQQQNNNHNNHNNSNQNNNNNSHQPSPNIMSQKHSVQSNKGPYQNDQKMQNNNSNQNILVNQSINGSVNQKKHSKNSNSLSTGMIIGQISGLKKHIKSQSAMKFQPNNFMNNFIKNQSNVNTNNNSTISKQQSQNPKIKSAGNPQQNPDLNSISQRMKTEEDAKYENEKNQAYFSSANRVQTDTNRKQRTLIMKLQRKNSQNSASNFNYNNNFNAHSGSVPVTNTNQSSKNYINVSSVLKGSLMSTTTSQKDNNMKHYSPIGFIPQQQSNQIYQQNIMQQQQQQIQQSQQQNKQKSQQGKKPNQSQQFKQQYVQ